MLLHLLIGGSLAVLATWYTARYPLAKITKIWAIGLLIAALIYLGFAGYHGVATRHIFLEIMGIGVYGSFIFLALRYDMRWLALGWGLHVVWDIVVHPYLATPCAPHWYPGVCLGFDLVVAAFLIWRHKLSTNKVSSQNCSRFLSS